MGRYKKEGDFGKFGGTRAPWHGDSRGAAEPGAGVPAPARAASAASAAAPRSSCSLKTSKAKGKGVKMREDLPKIRGRSSRELWRCHPMDPFAVRWLESEVLYEISNLGSPIPGRRGTLRREVCNRQLESSKPRHRNLWLSQDSWDRPQIPHGCGDIPAPRPKQGTELSKWRSSCLSFPSQTSGLEYSQAAGGQGKAAQ